MSICGYSDKMKLGLEEFSAGVFDSMVKKSPNGEIIPAQIALEQDQLASMILEGERFKSQIIDLDKIRKIEALNAIAYIARYFIGDEMVTSSSKLTEENLKSKASEIAKMIEKFDNAFDSGNKEQSNITRQRFAWSSLLR